MSETAPQPNPTQDIHAPIEYVVVEKPPRRWYRRPGCLLGLLVWLVVIMMPTFFIIMAIEGEITIQHRGDIPSKERYPLFQIKLVMEPDYRGFSITRAVIHGEGSDRVCVRNTVQFLLWQGQGDDTSYCQCYDRDGPDADWQAAEMPPDGECE